MFPDEERVIRAARRWAALESLDPAELLDLDIDTDVVTKRVDDLVAAVRAFERGRKLRPLKVSRKESDET